MAKKLSKYEEITKKYQEMAKSRKESGDININDYLPSISDMLKEDCVWDVLEGMQKDVSKDKDKKEDIAYYAENPPLTTAGYYEKQQCFVLRPSKFAVNKGDWELGNITGDVWSFNLDDLDAGGEFTINNKTYKTYKEYANANKIVSSKIKVKSASINASAVCHYTTVITSEFTVEKKYKDAMANGDAVMPHKIDRNGSTDPSKWKITDYKDDDKIILYKDKNGNCYQVVEDLNADDYLSEGEVEYDKTKKLAYVIVADGKWGRSTIKDGYKAQHRARDIIENKKIKDIVVIVDRGMALGARAASGSMYYNSLFFSLNNYKSLIVDIFSREVTNYSLSTSQFLPFGCDNYGTILGNVWVKMDTKDGIMWINLSKYVAAGADKTDINPSFDDAGLAAISGGVSDVFKNWNNANTDFKFVDSLNENGVKSYEDRIKLQKKLTGIDFSIARDHTVLLGDCLFMVPPEAIHSSTSLDYEKLPILRGKGSMMKNRSNIEEVIELELYFNNEYGINGIPYTCKTPNGTELTYKMNGLRALIAQFRVAPFLPIENHYINDVLNIEAVSLVNINVSTMEGFPRLLKVVLTLRDFNYRIYMPDLPFPKVNSDAEIAEMDPIFAKSFNWELFRYYYQRGLMDGDNLSSYKYNSYNYNDFLYSHRSVYKSADLTDSNFELYVPETSWLKYALQVKKARDRYGQINFKDDDDLNQDTTSDFTQKEFTTVYDAPKFTKSELEIKDIVKPLSELDSLGRCGVAFDIISYADHPEGDRNLDLSGVTPSGWDNNSYDFLKAPDNTSGSIYNRCHLIGYQLTGFGAEPRNLITGTRYLNVGNGANDPLTGGMVYYENLTANYLKENPDNHVAYRVTPVYNGNNLVAEGVYMEGYSIEDEGKGVSFYVFIRNSQPGVKIDYATGANKQWSPETEEIEFNYYDYKDPRNMKFEPYLQDENGKSVPLELDGISFTMSNYFTETHLKAVDGFAPQYVGGSDVSIELNMTITDEYFVSTLKNLPHIIMNMIKTYRRVMPCFPLKIKNEYLQMIGVNEVVFDNISVSTKQGHPGVFEVVMKFTSMDRSMRQREALRKVDAGNLTTSAASISPQPYFNLQKNLAAAELYPDLDLPRIEELAGLGWKFAKWANEDRKYVDPDFYLCYSFQYSSKLIKKIIKSVFYDISYQAGKEEGEKRENGEDPKSSKTKTAKDLNRMMTIDSTGMGAELSPGLDGFDIDKQLGLSELYNDIMDETVNLANSDDVKKKKKDSATNKKRQAKQIVSSIEYLTALGIENGWQIAPGWYAPLCDTSINDKLEKYKYSGIVKEKDANDSMDKYIEEIYDIRHRAIMLIDRILDKPLKSSKDSSGSSLEYVYDAVQAVLGSDDGKKLVELICPMQYKYLKVPQDKLEPDQDTPALKKLRLKSEYFEYADPYRWIQGFLYALACTRSGAEAYSELKKDVNWQPMQWQNPHNTQLYGGELIPNNKITQGRGIAGDAILCTSNDSWREDGVSFGLGQITKYNKSQIKEMLQPESRIKYFNYGYLGGASEYYNNMYHKTKRAGRQRFCETGFIDPYYNYAGYKSKEGKDFIEKISTSQTANYEALLREVLMYLKRLIMDGYMISEIDIISQDWESVLDEMLNLVEADGKISGNSTAANDRNYFVNSYRNDMLATVYDDGTGKEISDEEKEEQKSLSEKAEALKEQIPQSYNKLFCSRLIYPFILAACNGHKDVLKMFKDRNYSNLDTYSLSANIGGTNESTFTKFLAAMYGSGMIGSCNVLNSAEMTSNTQKAFNTLMSEAYTYMSSDPRCYGLHSMYDMCVTDKRGRLLRAFPCYYILFVDEGRTIGSWRLFDNFYNMSSISNLQVVKSRKMPADTCTFTMSNMFMSYADTYDNTIYQQYVDVYGFSDVFRSIFSPKSYISKEDAVRQRKQLTDTTPISPGVRIHVRMGYGSDGSRLPIAFNGKIAEINCGETVDIVAQGDGHELNNPLNTLGELTAVNFDESQGWFTLFKDIRGSLARGGQTPRNLLAKLSTAQYGGAFKTIVREYTEGRFFYDNPFGLYHFGDKRFKDLFEDSEIVQNMYEVSNKTMLNGVNDLLDDESTVNAAPIVNCNIQDKTMWEIGHLCANSGDDFYFAVRDFGLRSTMCLCKANHYYAYDYQEVSENDTIAEKRKPFQQWHYYDSFNDIVYNSLKASETNMKTNAVGTWEGTDWLWGTNQQSVGPIYLDMNIYPEYQKSMMVETGLVAGGNGGIDIPLLNALAEKFNYDEYQGRVSKSLAEKVTTNVLRQSVKDMYEGEICIIGDASLKPYDRATIMDIYEDVAGDIEIETVIHSMNIETGFTTTFIPDVIVRSESSSQEYGYQSVLSSVISGITAGSLKSFITYSSTKAGGGLIKMGNKAVVKKAADSIIQKGVGTALNKFVEGFAGMAGKDATAYAILTNPVAIASTAAAAAGVYVLTQSWKEMYFRWCRNIQALTVFPITKNGRLLIAGMAGHKGSVYGYNYPKGTAKNSIQGFLMDFMNAETDSTAVNVMGWIFDKVLCDENYEITRNKWINNLGLNTSNDIILKGSATSRNMEAFNQYLSNCISKEYTSRGVALAAMRTKPRVKKLDTSNRTSALYLKYQIGGVHDKNLGDEKEYKSVKKSELASNERIKSLLALEDEPDIQMAIVGDNHGVIKQFKFVHSTSPETFGLKMESEDTTIRYFTEDEKGEKVFDLPMLQEDAVMLIKLIINSDNLKGKTITLLGGTRVNSTASWKSTGFWFSLSCDDLSALEAASSQLKKDLKWNGQNVFQYKRTANSIQYTVYPQADLSVNSVYVSPGDDEDDE